MGRYKNALTSRPPLPSARGLRFKVWPRDDRIAACSNGTVWTCRPRNGRGKYCPWRQMHGSVTKRGYVMHHYAEGKHAFAHKIVLESFRGVRRGDMQCRHKDNNKRNNSLRNIKWDTCLENAKDRRRHGTQIRGERCHTAKLTSRKVLEIRKKLGSVTLRQLADKYGVTPQSVASIRDRESWSHL